MADTEPIITQPDGSLEDLLRETKPDTEDLERATRPDVQELLDELAAPKRPGVEAEEETGDA